MRGIGDVVLHLAAPLTRAGLRERAAIVARTAEIDLQDAVSCGRKQLGFRIEAPAVRNPERSAVGQHDQRNVLAIRARRQGEESMQDLPIARGELERPHLRHGPPGRPSRAG